MQSCVTKFFKPLDPALQDQYFDWLFEKEEADRKKREEERLAKIKAEKARLRQIRKEIEKKRKETLKRKREEESKRREEITRRKLEGQLVIPQLYLGTRLSAQNWHWLSDAQKEHKLQYILNMSSTIPNYFDLGIDSSFDIQDGLKELEELIGEDEMDLGDDRNSQENTSEEGQMPPEKDIKEWKDDENLFESLENLDDMKKLEILEKLDDDQEEIEEEVIDVEEKDETETVDIMEHAKKQMERDSNEELNLVYKRIPVEDSYEEDIGAYFEEGVNFIKEAVEKGSSILVHCREGRSRSVTMIVAYLIMEKKWSLLAAYEHMSTISPDININNGFKKQLIELEKEIHSKVSLDFFDKSTRVQSKVDYRDVHKDLERKERRSTTSTKKKPKAESPKVTIEIKKSDVYDTSDMPDTNNPCTMTMEEPVTKPRNILDFFKKPA